MEPGSSIDSDPFNREDVKRFAAELAMRGAYVGTSSWKYSDWGLMLYDLKRYFYHNKFSEARFNRSCLTEYAQVFKTVCVDAAYYTFPTEQYLRDMVAQTPTDFLFTFKVTDEITVKQFPNLPRFGARAGAVNKNFLNADLFKRSFLEPMSNIHGNVGILIFEFSRFHKADYGHGREFMEELDGFLGALPTQQWRFGVEIRNKTFLQPEYFAMLGSHRVAHVFNAWGGMPPVHEQMALPGSFTTPDFVGARLLLQPGMTYAKAVERYSPYHHIRDPYPEGRAAGADLLRRANESGGRTKAFVYVNNRFEGTAPSTIAHIIAKLRK